GMALDTYVLSPPSCNKIHGRGCAYWVIRSSMKLPVCSAIVVTMEAASTGSSMDEICEASYALSTVRANPRYLAMRSRFNGQLVPFSTVVPMEDLSMRA